MQWTHIPVLAREITDFLITDPDGVYLDATLGLGGHTKFFISKLSPKGRVIGLDKDPGAVKMAVENVNDARLSAYNLSYLQAREALEKALCFPEGSRFVISVAIGTPDDDKAPHALNRDKITLIS